MSRSPGGSTLQSAGGEARRLPGEEHAHGGRTAHLADGRLPASLLSLEHFTKHMASMSIAQTWSFLDSLVYRRWLAQHRSLAWGPGHGCWPVAMPAAVVRCSFADFSAACAILPPCPWTPVWADSWSRRGTGGYLPVDGHPAPPPPLRRRTGSGLHWPPLPSDSLGTPPPSPVERGGRRQGGGWIGSRTEMQKCRVCGLWG